MQPRSRERSTSQAVLKLALGTALALFLTLTGCSTFSRGTFFSTQSKGTITTAPSANTPLESGSLPKPVNIEVSPGTPPAEGDKAARKALTAAEKAAAASKAAAAASAQALQASQQASKAAKEAACAAAQTNPGANSSGDTNSGANGSGDRRAASPRLPQVNPSPALGLVTSSTKYGDEQARLNAERTIGKLQGAMAHIDPAKLNRDDTQRHALGTQLLKGAQKAFSERDYSAADSLATKASVLLAPLANGVEVPGPAGH